MLRQERPLDRMPVIAQLEPYNPADFETNGIPEKTVQKMVSQSHGDGRLFASLLNLHEFEQREHDGQLGVGEDPVAMYDQLRGDINQRLWNLQAAHEVRLSAAERRKMFGGKLGSAAVQHNVRHLVLPTEHKLVA